MAGGWPCSSSDIGASPCPMPSSSLRLLLRSTPSLSPFPFLSHSISLCLLLLLLLLALSCTGQYDSQLDPRSWLLALREWIVQDTLLLQSPSCFLEGPCLYPVEWGKEGDASVSLSHHRAKYLTNGERAGRRGAALRRAIGGQYAATREPRVTGQGEGTGEGTHEVSGLKARATEKTTRPPIMT